jgi:two-component system, chemotaxis family, CheB/CheR fusion protein
MWVPTRERRDHRVLVVDDYPDSAAIVAALLTLLGYECRTAMTGSDALEVAARFDPQTVLLDIGLPDISGYEVARELRAHARGRSLHLAAITGWGQPADRTRALAAGFDQFLLKPIDAKNLQDLIRLSEDATGGIVSAI